MVLNEYFKIGIRAGNFSGCICKRKIKAVAPVFKCVKENSGK
jgi:hypothetical protein